MLVFYDAIFLSPHLDDAVLSCGGTIALLAAAGPVLVLTVMAGDPPAGPRSDFAQSLHDRWGLPDGAAAARRAEDAAACDLLGADHLHWDVPDCIYRADPVSGEPLYTTEAALFGAVHDAESALVERLARQLAGLPAAGRLYVPLGVGGHVDHQIVRRAAEQAGGPAFGPYYEEFPYVRRPGSLAAALGDPGSWQADVVPLQPGALRRKIAAIACHASQLSTFFSGPADLADQVTAHATSVGGERYWRPAAARRLPPEGDCPTGSPSI